MKDFNELINSDQPVLVDFYAAWCGPCQMLAPELEKVAADFKGKARVIKIDIDRNQAAAGHYKVMGVPTLMIFKQGEIRWRQSGLIPAQVISEALSQNL